MGRWSSRDTVEESRVISAAWLNKHDYFMGGCRYGGMKWTNHLGKQTASIGFLVYTDNAGGYIRFQYTLTKYSEEKKELDYQNQLTSILCRYGGRRWWFICALTVNGVYCGRRVGKLYLPPGGSYFGCRHCYNLTYESCKDSHKFDRMAVSLGLRPVQWKELFK